MYEDNYYKSSTEMIFFIIRHFIINATIVVTLQFQRALHYKLKCP